MLQPYRDIYKLLAKEARVAHTASPLFRAAPYIVFVATWMAASTVPLLAVDLPVAAVADIIVLVGLLALARVFLALAGMDVGTAFGGMGASREMLIGALAEPAMLMAVFTLTMTAHSTNLSSVIDYHLNDGLVLRPSYLFALGGLVLVTIAETGRIPVDNPSTHLELTMIHEAMLLEYSGRHLALMEWAARSSSASRRDPDRQCLPALGDRTGDSGPSRWASALRPCWSSLRRSRWHCRWARRCWRRCGSSAPRPSSTWPCSCRSWGF